MCGCRLSSRYRRAGHDEGRRARRPPAGGNTGRGGTGAGTMKSWCVSKAAASVVQICRCGKGVHGSLTRCRPANLATKRGGILYDSGVECRVCSVGTVSPCYPTPAMPSMTWRRPAPAVLLPPAWTAQPFPAEPLACAMNVFARSGIRSGRYGCHYWHWLFRRAADKPRSQCGRTCNCHHAAALCARHRTCCRGSADPGHGRSLALDRRGKAAHWRSGVRRRHRSSRPAVAVGPGC